MRIVLWIAITIAITIQLALPPACLTLWKFIQSILITGLETVTRFAEIIEHLKTQKIIYKNLKI
jgi:hypothetical protein